MARSQGGIRVYTEDGLEWARFFERLKVSGMPIAEIEEYIDLYRAGDSTIDERRRIVYARRDAIDAQLADLKLAREFIDYKCWYYDVAAESGTCDYGRAGGVVDPLPADAPFFVADYHAYYKTDRGYHPRSLNSNDGWNKLGTLSFLNQPICCYTNEIERPVLLVHGENAHSCYFSRDEYAKMIEGSSFAANKELMIVPDAVHTDLYDGGPNRNLIPFDKLEQFFADALAK